MNRFLVCSNAKCCFLLDRRINGSSADGLQQVLTKCPDCGSQFSSTCPSCGEALAVRSVAGRPRRVCCNAKAHSSVEIAERPLAMAAQFGA